LQRYQTTGEGKRWAQNMDDPHAVA
jgi:hypothetical protein